METWAYCDGCQRWFYVAASDHVRLDHACPACERVSDHVVSAGEPASAAGRMPPA